MLATNVSYSPYSKNPSPLFYQPLQLLRKMNNPPLLDNKQNSNPHLFSNVWEIQLRLIKTSCFTYSLLQIKPLIIFKNLSFAKLPEKILTRHVLY